MREPRLTWKFADMSVLLFYEESTRRSFPPVEYITYIFRNTGEII